ncbi:hypothetical protein C8R46DRAFT_518717, partial [Mycena filopes]
MPRWDTPRHPLHRARLTHGNRVATPVRSDEVEPVRPCDVLHRWDTARHPLHRVGLTHGNCVPTPVRSSRSSRNLLVLAALGAAGSAPDVLWHRVRLTNWNGVAARPPSSCIAARPVHPDLVCAPSSAHPPETAHCRHGARDGEPLAAARGAREGMGYDVCVECHEMAPFPSVAHLRAAEEHLTMLDGMWEERVRAGTAGGEGGGVRPPPSANAVIHLPFPSAPSNTAQTMNALLPVIAFLERCLRPVVPPAPTPPTLSSSNSSGNSTGGSGARRWSTFPAAVSPAAFFPSPPAPTTPHALAH